MLKDSGLCTALSTNMLSIWHDLSIICELFVLLETFVCQTNSTEFGNQMKLNPHSNDHNKSIWQTIVRKNSRTEEIYGSITCLLSSRAVVTSS